MRNILMIISALLVSCASLTFDAGEFDRFTSMKHMSDSLISECGTPSINKSVDELYIITEHQFEYTAHRPGRAQITKATADVFIMTASLKQHVGEYSKIYCQEKLKNISAGTAIIIHTIGDM